MKILLADKDPYDLHAMRLALEAPGREILLAPDGREAVEMALAQSPDVIVVASSLASMGGFAVSLELKTLAGRGDLPEPRIIIIVERSADSWLAKWSKCDRWLAEPIDFASLNELVGELALTRE